MKTLRLKGYDTGYNARFIEAALVVALAAADCAVVVTECVV